MVTTGEELCDAESEEELCAIDSLDSLEEEDTGDTTSAWIMGGSEDIQGQDILSEGLFESDQSSHSSPKLDYKEQPADAQIQCSPSDQSHFNRDSDLDSLVAEPDTDSPLMSDILSGNAQLRPTDTDGDTETQVHLLANTKHVGTNRQGQ